MKINKMNARNNQMYQEQPLSPPCDFWLEYAKPQLIENMIKDICADIAHKGSASRFTEFFDMLFLHIEDTNDFCNQVEAYDAL